MSIGLSADPLYFKATHCDYCGADFKYACTSKVKHKGRKIKHFFDKSIKMLEKLTDQDRYRLMIKGTCGYCGADKKFWDKIRYEDALCMYKGRRTYAEGTLEQLEWSINPKKQRGRKDIYRNSKKK